jgi:hypothetical protein
MKWLDRLIIAGVSRRLSAVEQQLTGQVDATRAKLMSNIASFDRQITEHLAQLEDDVIRMLHRCDCDSLLDWERDAAVRSIFRKAN